MTKPTAVIFDLDGVLASNDHVMHHIKVDEPDWQSFNDGLHECAPIEGWVALTQLLEQAGHRIVILTNRSTDLDNLTITWLHEHDIRFDLLLMRPPGTPYSEAKAERLTKVMEAFKVVLAVEDDPGHVRMYAEHGIPCLYAHSGYYDDGITAGVETADSRQ